MDRDCRVVQIGLGPIGCRIARQLIARDDFAVVAAIDLDPGKAGRDLGTLCGGEPLGLTVEIDAARALGRVDAEVAVVATASSLEAVRPQVEAVVGHGLCLVSTCEELVYPWRTAPVTARALDGAARAAGVAILSTGINPGFLMDCLPATLSGLCRRVERVRVERIQDAGRRRVPFQRKIGAGLGPRDFARAVAAGTLRHVGLTESMHLIADALGWGAVETADSVEPVIAERPLAFEGGTIAAGHALGVEQVGRAWRGGDQVITLTFRATIGEPSPCDRLRLDAEPPVEMTIAGGVNGDLATCNLVVNAIPAVLSARPGLRTMLDVGAVSCRGWVQSSTA